MNSRQSTLRATSAPTREAPQPPGDYIDDSETLVGENGTLDNVQERLESLKADQDDGDSIPLDRRRCSRQRLSIIGKRPKENRKLICCRSSKSLGRNLR
jgi:hypothetical protein